MAIIILTFLLLIKKLNLASIIIGFTTIGYSLTNDILFGDRLKLFYYISPDKSTFYMVLSAILLYPMLNIIYLMFLPRNIKPHLLYTSIWIAAMLVFEYASLKTKTIVFTGWQPIPWSIVVYIVTYLWINIYYSILTKRLNAKK
jgi:hypothetical protein